MAQENIKGIFPLNAFTMEELEIFFPSALTKKGDKRKMIKKLETNLKNIRRISSLRKRGSTPKRIAQHQSQTMNTLQIMI